MVEPHHCSQQEGPGANGINQLHLAHSESLPFPRSVSGRRRRVILALGWYDQQIHHGIARFARSAGWSLDTRAIRDGELVPPLRADGIIGIFTPQRPQLTQWVMQAHVPTVDLANLETSLQVPRVLIDPTAIAEIAAEYFMSRGFRQYATLYVKRFPIGRERCEAFQAVLQEHGYACAMLDGTRFLPMKRPLLDQLAGWLSRKLANLPKPLAFLVPSDHMSAPVFEACELASLNVPEQVAILGVNNNSLECDFTPVPLSSVDANLDQAGFEAARLLADLMDGGVPPTKPLKITPRGVVTRMSTRSIAVPHPDVASALRFIAEYYSQPIMVDDVAAHVSMSRIGLYRAFKRYLGRSVAEEIARQRIESAQRLLTTSSKKIYEIASLCGFGDVDSFSRTFSRLTRLSPRAYRVANLLH
jgi:LacI family transcriptional regulator